MKYLTTYIMQPEEEGISLLLQQYSCRGIPVCIACLCTCERENKEAGRKVTGQLLDWCRHFPWHKAVRRPEKWMARAEEELGEKTEKCLKQIRYAGEHRWSGEVKWKIILCIGEEILILGNGQAVYLLSMSLGRGSVRRLSGGFRGISEPGAGILLTTEGAVCPAEEKELGEVLRLSELEKEEQADRHLREFAKESAEKIRAAIMLLAEEDDYE